MTTPTTDCTVESTLTYAEGITNRFDKKFCSLYGFSVYGQDGRTVMRNADTDELKSFINNEILTIIEGLMKDVEWMKKEQTMIIDTNTVTGVFNSFAYNSAIQDFLIYLSQLKEIISKQMK